MKRWKIANSHKLSYVSDWRQDSALVLTPLHSSVCTKNRGQLLRLHRPSAGWRLGPGLLLHIAPYLQCRGFLIHTCVPFLACLIPCILLGAAVVPFPHEVYADTLSFLHFMSNTLQDSQHPPARFLKNTMQFIFQGVAKRNK